MKVWVVVSGSKVSEWRCIEGVFSSKELAVSHIESLVFDCWVNEFGFLDSWEDPEMDDINRMTAENVSISPTTRDGEVWKLRNPLCETVVDVVGRAWHIEEYEVVGA